MPSAAVMPWQHSKMVGKMIKRRIRDMLQKPPKANTRQTPEAAKSQKPPQAKSRQKQKATTRQKPPKAKSQQKPKAAKSQTPPKAKSCQKPKANKNQQPPKAQSHQKPQLTESYQATNGEKVPKRTRKHHKQYEFQAKRPGLWHLSQEFWGL